MKPLAPIGRFSFSRIVQPRRPAALGLLAAVLTCPATGWASGGVVQPSSATTLGYTLTDLAQQTALYFTGQITSNPATPAPPSIPFQILVNDATVAPNTYLYLPIYFADDSDPIPPAFPASVTDQVADGTYLANLVNTDFGVTSFLTQVDGVTTLLNNSYTVGVTTPPLLDGAPNAGTHYIVNAVVLSPLSPGTHTVAFGGVVNGQQAIFGSDIVTVTPEPTAAMLLGIAGLLLPRRR